MFLTSTLSGSDVTQITENTSKFDFIGDIPGILEGLVSDIVRLINTLPGWLSTLVFVVIGIMLFAIALKVVSFVLDAIPFV